MNIWGYNKIMRKNRVIVFVCVVVLVTAVFPILGQLPTAKIEALEEHVVDHLQYSLPPPLPVSMLLERSMCRRMSVRSFTTASVTDQQLSTILWAAYGYTQNGSRTIVSPNGTYSAVIYVIRSEATYKYIPANHSLQVFKTGNYLSLGEYDTAPVKFGLVWNMSITPDELSGMAEIGMIGQNIYFDANALDLGTVTTGMSVTDLYSLGIPANEKPEIIMPLGHPSSPYSFTYTPLPVVNLPRVVNNTYSLADAVNNSRVDDRWDGLPLSLLEQSQLIWSSYGCSYNMDNVNHVRHRTLPSAIDIYPFKVFAANQTGVYQYVPSTHSLTTIVLGDRREQINGSLGSTSIVLPSASWIILPFWDTTVGSSTYRTFWYYEVGAITHNVFLEAAALHLSANVITSVSNPAGLRTALGISSQTNLIPWFVIPVGHFNSSNHQPAAPDLFGPSSGTAGTL